MTRIGRIPFISRFWLGLCFSLCWAVEYTDSITIDGNNSVGPFLLGRFAVDSASLEVKRDDQVLVPGLHFRFVKEENSIFLEEPLPDTIRLQVRYRKARPYIQKYFFRRDASALMRDPFGQTESDSMVSVPAQEEKAKPPPGQFLQVGGMKTFGVSASSGGGMSLEQSLQVRIQGQVTQGTHIRASLSDQNIPLQPEGTTRTLGEIEQARIDIEGQKFGATLGDFYDSENSRFVRFSKKIQGVQGEALLQPWKLRLAGATSQGTYRSYSFIGAEGKQGPYRLKGKHNETNIVVLAGTETIWLDGEKMTRGENHDYIIDYSAGWITFMPRKMITSESEVTATYEYLEQDYERSLLHGRAQFELGKVSVQVTGIQEQDSPKNPLQFLLTDQDKSLLAHAGDTEVRTGALRSINILEAGEHGFYLLIDSAGTSFYRYYDADSLDAYQIEELFGPSFYPALGGDYVADTIPTTYGSKTVYRYVGQGQGSYSPGSILPKPVSQRIVDVATSGEMGLISFRTEVAASNLDQNMLSGTDDHDNMGLGAELMAGVGLHQEKGVFFKVDMAGKDSTFQPFGAVLDDYHFRRRWNLLERPYDPLAKNRWAEATLGWQQEDRGRLQVEAGELRSSVDRTRRAGVETSARMGKDGRFWGRNEEVFGSYTLIQAHLHRDGWVLQLPTKILGPFAEVEHEWTVTDSAADERAFGFQDVTVGLAPGRRGHFEPKIEAGLRRDRLSNASGLLSGTDSIRTYHVGLTTSMMPWHGLSFQSAMSQRRRILLFAQGDTEVFDLADIRTRYEPGSRALAVRTDYILSATELQGQHDVYRFVGQDNGFYEKDSLTQDFRPKRGGGWDLVGRAADSAATGRDIELSTWVKVRPVHWKKTGGFLDDITATFSLELSSQRLANAGTTRDRYLPSWGFSPAESTTTVDQRASYKQDILFHPNNRSWKVRMRWMPSRLETFRYGQEVQENMITRGDLEQGFGKKVKTRLSLEQEDRRRSRALTLLEYDIRNRMAEAEVQYQFNRPYVALLKTGVGQSYERKTNGLYYLYSVSPAVTRNFSGKGRVRVDYEWHWVQGEAGTLYYQMAKGFSKGLTHQWSLTTDYRIGENLSLTFYYFGRLEENAAKPFHQANMDLRAYF